MALRTFSSLGVVMLTLLLASTLTYQLADAARTLHCKEGAQHGYNIASIARSPKFPAPSFPAPAVDDQPEPSPDYPAPVDEPASLGSPYSPGVPVDQPEPSPGYQAPDDQPAATPGKWPTATSRVKLDGTINIAAGETFDGGLKEYYGAGDGGQSEGQPPAFDLEEGATLENVIIGAPAGDGVHCKGSCVLRNIWWLDVGEDAASFKGKDSNAKYLVDGGGAKSATDKVFQFNGGGTLTVQNFQVYGFGKVVRSCGTCTDIQRHIVVNNIYAETSSNSVCIVGINSNNGDTAKLSNIIIGGSKTSIPVCEKYHGTKSIGEGSDGSNCQYSDSAISYA